jgi:hypothetical protein
MITTLKVRISISIARQETEMEMTGYTTQPLLTTFTSIHRSLKI